MSEYKIQKTIEDIFRLKIRIYFFSFCGLRKRFDYSYFPIFIFMQRLEFCRQLIDIIKSFNIKNSVFIFLVDNPDDHKIVKRILFFYFVMKHPDRFILCQHIFGVIIKFDLWHKRCHNKCYNGRKDNYCNRYKSYS